MNSIEIKEKDSLLIAGTYKRSNLCLKKGKGATVQSFEDKEYIDFTSGIGVNSLGFSHLGWVEAITNQAAMLQHTSNLYYTQPGVQLGEILIEKSNMKKVFFCNSGAEANECAIKTVRKYSNEKYGNERNQIITLKNSFHGRTLATITATGQEDYHKYFHPFVEGFVYVELNNIQDLEEKICEKTCAIMIELIQGEGGVNNLKKEYVDNIAKKCKEKDILLIVDEVQTGIGRTGTMFAFQQYGILPDIVTLAKGLGGGLPIGCVLFNEKTEKVLNYGDHGTTFGGNPVVCAGSIYILNLMDEEMLSEISYKGEYIRQELLKIKNVEYTSGLGLMIGVKLKDINPTLLSESCLEEGLIILTAKDKIRLLPPLNITMEEVEKGLDILKKVLKEYENMV